MLVDPMSLIPHLFKERDYLKSGPSDFIFGFLVGAALMAAFTLYILVDILKH